MVYRVYHHIIKDTTQSKYMNNVLLLQFHYFLILPNNEFSANYLIISKIIQVRSKKCIPANRAGILTILAVLYRRTGIY